MKQIDKKENKPETKSEEERYTLDHTIVVYLMGP